MSENRGGWLVSRQELAATLQMLNLERPLLQFHVSAVTCPARMRELKPCFPGSFALFEISLTEKNRTQHPITTIWNRNPLEAALLD
jgi:hypothetical protein